jgi:hypothetical protein
MRQDRGPPDGRSLPEFSTRHVSKVERAKHREARSWQGKDPLTERTRILHFQAEVVGSSKRRGGSSQGT